MGLTNLPIEQFAFDKERERLTVLYENGVTEAFVTESQLTQLKADNAKLRDGLEECLMAFQAEDLLLDEKRVQALLEQTSQSPNKEE